MYESEVLVPHVGWLRHEPGDEVARLLREGHFEAAEQAFFWLFLREGDAFLDCGSHVGLFAVLAGEAMNRRGRLVCLEPNPATADLLRANLQAHGLTDARVVQAAAWSSATTLQFAPDQPGRAAYAHIAEAAEPAAIAVPAVTLDQVTAESAATGFTLAKIDTEGAEPEVLRGAQAAVKVGHLPVVMLEFNEGNLRRNGQSTRGLFDLVEQLGWSLHRFDPGTLRLVPAAYAGEIWYENLFATTQPDRVNEQLAGAAPERVRIARDLLARARTCSKFKELEELERYKHAAAEADAMRRWAQRSDALVKAMNRHGWLKLGRFIRIMTRDEAWVRKRQSHETAPPVGLPEAYAFKTETALDHLGRRGFDPKVVLDVGAAKGYWSELASHYFPQAQFYLLEPLSGNVPPLQELSGKFPNFHFVSCAAGESPADLFIHVMPDGNGSSLLPAGEARQPQDEKVKVVTIDSLLANGTLRPPQLVKLAVHGYELRALAGGSRLFDTTEVFLLKVSLYESLPGTPLFHEVVAYMAERGYVVFDVAGFLRRPSEEDLAKVELVFVKGDSPLVAGKR